MMSDQRSLLKVLDIIFPTRYNRNTDIFPNSFASNSLAHVTWHDNFPWTFFKFCVKFNGNWKYSPVKISYAGDICYRVAEGQLLLVVIISLLESLMSPFPLVKVTAQNQITYVARHKNVKIQTLFMQFRQPVCKVWSHSVHAIFRQSVCKV